MDQLKQRALDLQRERDVEAEVAVRAERERITRELHDVVAHSLSVMVLQAQGAAAALDQHPRETKEALGAIVETGRESLAEMRRLMGLVRRPPDQAPDYAPQPSLEGLPTLISEVGRAGVPVELIVEGAARPLPPTVAGSAYRIVQEGLTNTMKHAGSGVRAIVRVRYRDEAIEIDVEERTSKAALRATY